MPTTQAEPLLLDTSCLATPRRFDSPSPAIPSRQSGSGLPHPDRHAFPGPLSSSRIRSSPLRHALPALPARPHVDDMPSPTPPRRRTLSSLHQPNPSRHAWPCPPHYDKAPIAVRHTPGPADYPSRANTWRPGRPLHVHPRRQAMRQVVPPRSSPSRQALTMPARNSPETDMPSLPQHGTASTPRRASPQLTQPTCQAATCPTRSESPRQAPPSQPIPCPRRLAMAFPVLTPRPVRLGGAR